MQVLYYVRSFKHFEALWFANVGNQVLLCTLQPWPVCRGSVKGCCAAMHAGRCLMLMQHTHVQLQRSYLDKD